MPRKVNTEAEQMDKWNFYVSKLEKAQFVHALIVNGKNRAQSAALRALMHLYINDEEVKNKVNEIVEDFKVYKQDGDTSRL